MSLRPFYIVIDIDGTLIGDVTPQVCEWELIQKYDKSKLKQFKKSFCDLLKAGLLRPGFTTFIDQVKLMHPNTEFYIYTSSESRWASFIIPCIESITGVRFARPLFTRAHCLKVNDEYKKSLGKIAPKIHEKLSDKISLADMLSHTLLIDNSNVILKQEVKSIVICPTYKYVHIRDVTRLLDTEKINNNFHSMISLMVSYNMFPKSDLHITLQQFYALHYKHIYQLISHLHKEERHLENDKDQFWPLLGQIFSKLETSKASKELLVKLINEKIRYKGLL